MYSDEKPCFVLVFVTSDRNDWVKNPQFLNQNFKHFFQLIYDKLTEIWHLTYFPIIWKKIIVVRTKIFFFFSGQAQEKYLSLGPDIYGKIKTLFTTFTYFTTDLLGSVAKSMEVITQVSTSLFSTTSLPPSITLASSINVDGQNINNNNVQLSADELQSIKESYLSNNYQTQSPDLTPGMCVLYNLLWIIGL